MALNIKSKIKVLTIHIQCVLLYLRIFIFWQKLSVNRLLFVNNLNLHTREVEFLLDVIGCYKISVKGLGIFPGKTSRIRYVFQAQNNLIEINFFGLGGQKETKVVRFENALINLKDKFYITTTTPQLSSTYISSQNFECLLFNSIEKTKEGINAINIEPQYLMSNNLNVEFKPFIKSDYSNITL